MSAQISQEFLAALAKATPARVEAALRALTTEEPPAPAPADDSPLLMTINHAARRLNVSRTTVRRAIMAGRLQKVEIYAGSYRLRRADVEAIASPRK